MVTTRTWTMNGDDWAAVQPVTSGVLTRAELVIKGDDFSLSSPMWPDRSGNSHHGQLGSAAGSDTNDPVTLKKGTAGKYVWLPGTDQNRLGITNADAYKITGKLGIELDVAIEDITDCELMTMQISGTTGWGFYLSAGNWRFGYGNGSALNWNLSIPSSGLVAGERMAIRAERDPATGTFEVWVNDVSQGSDTDAADTISYAADPTFQVGDANLGVGELQGKVYSYKLYEDDALFDEFYAADFVEPFVTVLTRTLGETIWIGRSSSGYVSTVVDRGMRAFSTDDYVHIADHADLDFADGEDLTIIAAYRQTDVDRAAQEVIVGKGDVNTNPAWHLYSLASNAASAIRLRDATTAATDTLAVSADHTLVVAAGRRDDATPSTELFLDGVSSGSPDTTNNTGDLSNALAARIGAATSGAYFEGQIMAVALFREALTDEEIVEAGEELLANTDYAAAAGLHWDALQVWLKANTTAVSHEVVGMLNELNGTVGVGYRKARATLLGETYP